MKKVISVLVVVVLLFIAQRGCFAQSPDVDHPRAILGKWHKHNGEVIEFFPDGVVKFTDSTGAKFTGNFWCLDAHLMRMELYSATGSADKPPWYSVTSQYTLSPRDLIMKNMRHDGLRMTSRDDSSPYHPVDACQ